MFRLVFLYQLNAGSPLCFTMSSKEKYSESELRKGLSDSITERKIDAMKPPGFHLKDVPGRSLHDPLKGCP